jgi:hypothetical protein
VRFELVAVLQAELLPDLVGKRDGQFAVADVGFRLGSFPQRYGTGADTALSKYAPSVEDFQQDDRLFRSRSPRLLAPVSIGVSCSLAA